MTVLVFGSSEELFGMLFELGLKTIAGKKRKTVGDLRILSLGFCTSQGPLVAPTPLLWTVFFLHSVPTRSKWYHCQVETVVKQGLELQLCVLECLILAGYDPQISRRDVTSASGWFGKKCWLVFAEVSKKSKCIYIYIYSVFQTSFHPKKLGERY